MQPTSSSSRHLRPAASSRQRSVSGSNVDADRAGSSKQTGRVLSYKDFENDMRRSNSTGSKLTEGLKRRFGSIRRGKKAATES